jgi:hypothetical protein
MCAPAIDARKFNGRVADFSVDFLNKSIFSTRILSTVNDSGTPPQDLHYHTSDLRGILPKQSMTERLRRANNLFPTKISNQHEQNMGHGVPKFFNIPSLLAQYPIQEERGAVPPQDHRVENISTPDEGQQSSFPSPFPCQPQFIQSGNNRSDIEQNMNGFNTGNANDGMPSNRAFGSVDNSALPGFSGFEFSLEEGQDINSLLNGAAWHGSTFQA